ncbi:hypothetical protein pb186bvf_007844 [Paramecium bursaria]
MIVYQLKHDNQLLIYQDNGYLKNIQILVLKGEFYPQEAVLKICAPKYVCQVSMSTLIQILFKCVVFLLGLQFIVQNFNHPIQLKNSQQYEYQPHNQVFDLFDQTLLIIIKGPLQLVNIIMCPSS